METSTLPVAVIGAGPVGLAAAAHLAARGLSFVVLEAGERVAASVRAWGHVRVFSPWRYNVDAAARALLDRAGWTPPDPDALPTGNDLADRYLYYVVGMKSYGRAPTFLMLTGYEQVRSVVAALAGDHEAARRVELKLPETGACSATPIAAAAAGAGLPVGNGGGRCCGA